MPNQDNSGKAANPCVTGIPLAFPYVQPQMENPGVYDTAEDALTQGTLYPHLNLPFYLKTKGEAANSSLRGQLQALEFVLLELGLYLDTHPQDKEAYALFSRYTKLAKEARESYQKKYGPLSQREAADGSRYSWVDGPWPWNETESEEA